MYPQIEISPHFAIPTYFVYLSLLYIGLLAWSFQKAKRINLHPRTAIDLFSVIMICGFIGARAFHVFFEEPQYYLENPIRIFYFWDGGFVYYGGAICAFLGMLTFIKIKKYSFWKWADFFAPIAALGYGLGRISCFLAGCCYGKYCALPWAMHTPTDPMPRHPTQLYATFYEVLLFLILTWIQKKNPKIFGTGYIFLIWLIGHCVGRIFMEQFRDDFRGTFYLGFSVSTWISVGILIGTPCFLVARRRQLGKR